MARRARAILAAHLRSFAGWMPASTGSCSTGVACKHAVIIRRVQLRLTCSRLMCLLLLHVGAQYSAGAYTSVRTEVLLMNFCSIMESHQNQNQLATPTGPLKYQHELSSTRCLQK